MTDGAWRERGLRDAVLRGDDRAWRAWYDAEHPGLEAYVLWRCGGLRDAADDVLQETWMTAVRKMRAFDPAAGSFRQWLCGIAANVVRNYLRSRRRRTARQEALTGEEIRADSAAPDRERAERIAAALAAMPDRYEAVLRMKYVDRMTVAAMAATNGETEKAVESLLSRARAAFREAYGDD
ncbi:MAG TPA: sigma-70 family RNA polymerase sigma factor [Gemmataceae bacterium]|jgi:RNA polymerase sigma-70 factor (ECF subfamily)|nr:sigma-70 family RNA polymerase sigma factor [Gemmataceae bacterium]